MQIVEGLKSKINILFRYGILHIFSANVINKIVMMLCNMVITRTMTINSYGIYAYVINIYSYLQVINALGLSSGAFQFGAKNRRNDKDYPFYKYCLRIGVVINFAIIAVMILIMQFYQPKVSGSKLFIEIYIPILILEYVFNILITILRCNDKIQEYAKILNYNTILLAIGTCIGSMWGIYGIIIGRYISYIVCLVYMLINQKQMARKIYIASELSDIQKKSLWQYSVFAGISSGITTIVYLLDVTMIANLIGDVEDVAYYKIATLIPTALAFIPLSVTTAIMPKIIDKANDSNWLKNKLKKVMMYLFIFNGVLCLCLIVCAPVIILLLSGDKYIGAVSYFRVLVFGYFFNGTFRTICVNVLSALEKVKVVLAINVFSSVCDIIMNYVLISRYGTIGASYATCFTVIIISVLSLSVLVDVIVKNKYKLN